MKENELRRLIRLVKKPCAKRVLALLLCAATLLSMMPIIALADAVAISDVTAPDIAEYSVDFGTELSDVQLPSELEITITEENGSGVRMEPVEWVGEYHKDKAGTYTLTAAFADGALAFSPMPVVRLTVAEPVIDLQTMPMNENPLGSSQDALEAAQPEAEEEAPLDTGKAAQPEAEEEAPLDTVEAAQPETEEEAPLDTVEAAQPETEEEAPLDTVEAAQPETEEEAPQDTGKAAQPETVQGGLEDAGQDEQKDDVDYSAVCKLIPNSTSYASGESIQFTLNAQYATPGDSSRPLTVKFGIPIPATSPAVQLPMFYMTGTGEYDGVPMYPLSYNGTTVNLYLVTNSGGNRRIEFTLDAGSTVQGTISMILPNGVSDHVPAFTLMPEILSKGDYGTNTFLDGGTTAVNAEFGWNNVNKSANTDNIGVIGAATKDPDRITYSVTADSKSSGLATGRIFTEHYVLSDAIRLSGLHYADGALTQSEADGISTFSVNGTPVLEILAPLSSLNVKKQAVSGKITAFDIRYTVFNTTLGNTDGTAAEMSNLNLSMSLLLHAMQLNDGNEDTLVTNTADFDAYSPYNDHHHSAASHTAYTRDRYNIEKTVYSDAACTIPATQVSANQEVWYEIVTKNNGAGTGPFSITDELPAGMMFQSATPGVPIQNGQTLTWDGVTIPSGETRTIVVKAKFDATKFVSNPVHNTVVLRKDGQRLDSDYADIRYLAGVVDDASIIYEKSVNRTSTGANDTLRYTISARNEQASDASKCITIMDKWPGASVRPTAIIGCTDYELLDAAGVSHTLADVKTADPPIEITIIKLYNVEVPKGGGKATVYIDGVVTKPVAQLKNEIIGSAGQNLATTYSVGVGISKAPYQYDDVNGIGAMLTNTNAVVADQVVCYQMTVRNLTDLAINDLTLTDKLPAGLTPVVGTVQGASGQAIIKRGSSYTPTTLTSGVATASYTPYTTATFVLDAKETVILYIFANVSAAAVAASNASNNCITNAAYVTLQNGLLTGDATANIYTFVDETQAFWIGKSIVFIADYDENLTTATTRLIKRENDTRQWGKNDIAWNGAYVGYQFQLINRNDGGANKDSVRVYELIDTLPQGMEFVGVCMNGGAASYTASKPTTLNNLGSQLIRDGETGVWSNGKYTAQALTCRYDPATNQVHISFNQDGSGVLPVKYHQNGATTDLKPYIYLVARVKDDAKQTLFHNTVDAKVDAKVTLNQLDKTATIRDGNGPDTGYKLISNYCDVSLIVYRPGIAKQLVGHYYPTDSTTPEKVRNENNLFPGETLRFQLQVGTGVSPNSRNREHINLQNFVVTDILPAEYVYRPDSATITLNAIWDSVHQTLQEVTSEKVLPRGTVEPSIERLSDGRTKLTWKFEGPDMRLFTSAYGFAANYFVHLITYDTDWNKTYAATYGNYTNYATVTHSQDFSSVYSGTPDYGEKSVTASAIVNVFGAAGTAAVKAVTNAANQTVTGDGTNPYVPVAGVGAEVTYSLRVTNATAVAEKSQTQSLVIIDELPRATGDTGVVNRVNRGSEFSVLFDDAPAVFVNKVVNGIETPVASTAYTVRYGNSVGGLNSAGDWTNSDTGGLIRWGTASNGMNAIRIAFLPAYSLAAGEAILVHFKALANDDADPGEIAWNSFGYSYKSLVGGKVSEKIYAEPPRVGIHVPGATIAVTKRVTGDEAAIATQFTFVLKQGGTPLANVKYTLSGDDKAYRTGVDGSFTLTATQTATMSVQPGSGYTVEETPPLPADFTLTGIAAAAAGDGTYDNATKVFTCKTLADGDSVGAICTNNYATPRTRDITVRKIWDGVANPNQPASVTVQLYKGGTAEGAPVTLNAGNLWRHTWQGLSTAESWSVDESDALPGYTKIITGDSVNGFVITNNYAPTPVVTAQVEAEKVINGDPNPPAETFFFRLTAVSYTAPDGSSDTMTPRQMPMPLGSINGMKTGSTAGAGRVAFGRFIFSKAGTYVYALREDNGTNAVYTYDRSVFTLTYTVQLSSEGKLLYTLAITKPGAAPNPTAVVFTNTYARPVGQLTVRKTVTNNGDVNSLFTFRFTFSEPTRYAYMKSDGTSGTIATGESLQLKHDQSVTVTIHQGVTYTVIEDAYTRYAPTPADRTSTGTVSATPSTAAFTNRYDPPYVPTLTGDLTVQKRVTGDLGDRNKDFAFQIVFNDPGSYSFTGSKTGTIKSGDMVLLRHGEYITIVNLPAGTTYSITESGNSGYRVYTSGDVGIIAANGVSVAAFTNSRSKVPLTGDDGALFTGVMLMLISLAGGAALLLAKKRLKRRRRRARSIG